MFARLTGLARAASGHKAHKGEGLVSQLDLDLELTRLSVADDVVDRFTHGQGHFPAEPGRDGYRRVIQRHVEPAAQAGRPRGLLSLRFPGSADKNVGDTWTWPRRE